MFIPFATLINLIVYFAIDCKNNNFEYSSRIFSNIHAIISIVFNLCYLLDLINFNYLLIGLYYTVGYAITDSNLIVFKMFQKMKYVIFSHDNISICYNKYHGIR